MGYGHFEFLFTCASQNTLVLGLVAPGPKPGSNSCGVASTRGNCDDVFSDPMFRDLERMQTVFTGIAAHLLFGANLSYDRQTLNGQGLLVSGSYFPVLGMAPALGRLIGPADEPAVGESHVVVLSHRYWRTRFGANPNVLDQTMNVNGQTMTIVGVAPVGFDGTTVGVEPRVFVPLTMRAEMQPTWKGGMSDQTIARFRAKPILLEPGARGQSAIPNRAGPSMKVLLASSSLSSSRSPACSPCWAASPAFLWRSGRSISSRRCSPPSRSRGSTGVSIKW
jgi:hypothetical protein